ncbi:hypothetical protein [Methylobacterium sp. PvR107]|uniref:hypothetical protein n=1 Tax=Methylobacterium sp. PvR107 TaxID=2806597 RepID=UPI001B77111D|nr:hypothetical protein [Methylobacterium sp. PvR107]MBP1178453.1 hypothetical protein [Methylobacterium sp. PvR107]
MARLHLPDQTLLGIDIDRRRGGECDAPPIEFEPGYQSSLANRLPNDPARSRRPLGEDRPGQAEPTGPPGGEDLS